MAQKSDNAQWSLKPWAGTLDQLVRAAALCAERIAEAAPYPPGYAREDRDQPYEADKENEWHDATIARKVQIGVVEHDGFQRALGEIDDLRAWPVEDLSRIKRLDIEIGSGGGYVPMSAKFELGRGGMDIRVSGKHRTWTAGLRHGLNEILAPRERLRPRGFSNEGVVLAAAGPVWIIGFFAILALLRTETGFPEGVRIALDLAIPSVLAGFLVLLVLRLPGMELLAPGAKPKYQRVKGKIVAVAVALVVAIAGGLIVAVILHQS
jgi:hypothetical protein